MKLWTEMVDFHGRMLPRSDTHVAHFATEHDAACAHALLQAKNEVLANVIYHDLRTLIDIRADEIMAGWGFDSGEESIK